MYIFHHSNIAVIQLYHKTLLGSAYIEWLSSETSELKPLQDHPW